MTDYQLAHEQALEVIADLTERNNALRTALKPFAAMALFYEAEISNTCLPCDYELNPHDPHSATAEHAIHAREVLANTEQKQ